MKNNTKAVSITMPVEMYKDAEQTAKKENRTFSEFVREAIRRYNWEKDFDQVQAYGRARAEQLGVKEEDIPMLVREPQRAYMFKKRK